MAFPVRPGSGRFERRFVRLPPSLRIALVFLPELIKAGELPVRLVVPPALLPGTAAAPER